MGLNSQVPATEAHKPNQKRKRDAGDSTNERQPKKSRNRLTDLGRMEKWDYDILVGKGATNKPTDGMIPKGKRCLTCIIYQRSCDIQELQTNEADKSCRCAYCNGGGKGKASHHRTCYWLDDLDPVDGPRTVQELRDQAGCKPARTGKKAASDKETNASSAGETAP